MEPSPQQSLIGATIGNYKVVAKLGEGGMGSVYLAEHPLIGKKVALKVLHEEYSANQDVVSRFFNEAKAVNDIQHPNIVDIIDYGVVQAPGAPGFVYFIMEFLGGEALASLIQRESPLPPERAFAIGMQVADALSASHAKGIIHRDLKPDNIYLIPRGREKDFVKVLDFGIAKLTGDAPGSRRTRTGIVMGTPAYMSPEQCEGKGNIDARTDIYALGIVLYEMITGRVPFAGEGYGEVLVQHLTKRPERPTTPLGAVPPHVEAVIMKSLEKRREDRYQTMDEFIQALRDPALFIDQRGGLDAFYQPDAGGLVGSSAALAPGQARTPVGLRPATPGLGTRVQTQPGVAAIADGDDAPPAKKKTGLFLAVGGVVAAAVVGLVVATSGGKKADAPPPTAEAKPALSPEPKPPEPVAPETPPAAATVTVRVSSTPPGAEVFFGGEATSRGKTPTVFEVPKKDGQSELVVKLDGHDVYTRSVDTSRSSELDALLVKTQVATPTPVKPSRPSKPSKPPSKPSKPGKPGGPGSDDVLSPF